MKISTLIKREPFGKIFETTISSFLSDINGKSYSVNWKQIKLEQIKVQSSQTWFCNPLINSIFVKDVNINVFNSINGEYQFNPIYPWRSVFQKIYLTISESRLFRVFFSKYLIEIYPEVKDSKTKLFIGGNKKIRIIDIKNKEVYVILKKGFDKKFLNRDIFIRDNFDYLPLPKILKRGKKNFWYSEEYLIGKPPNRLKGNNSIIILERAICDIRKLNFESRISVNISEYLDNLKNKIFNQTSTIPNFESNLAEEIKNITVKLIDTILEKFNCNILISQCHGDFHQGNILSNGKKYWIIDWENTGVRQIGYDLFIFLLDTRVEKGFAKRFLKLYNFNMNSVKINIIKNWPELIENNSFKKEYLLIFLLEDLIFYLDEINNKLFYDNSSALKSRIYDFKLIFNKLKL